MHFVLVRSYRRHTFDETNQGFSMIIGYMATFKQQQQQKVSEIKTGMNDATNK